jgi:hypothetical protein
VAEAAGDVPTLLVRVTVTETMAVPLPVTVNGWVNVNWLPKGADAALEYQGAKIALTGTVSCVVPRLEPEAAEKVKLALLTSRDGE